jgi:hypothetical protein
MDKDADLDLEYSENMTDHQIFSVLDTRGEIGDLSMDEGWAILAERYPDDARFLLLNLFEEMNEARYPQSYPLEMFFRKLRRLMKLRAQVPEPLLHTFLSLTSATIAEEMDEQALGEFEDLVMSSTEGHQIIKRSSAAFQEGLRVVIRFSREVVRAGLDQSVASGSLPARRGADDAEMSYADWDARTEGKPAVTYASSQPVSPGDRVSHPKFGVGFVVGAGKGRADILFKDRKRRLVCG